MMANLPKIYKISGYYALNNDGIVLVHCKYKEVMGNTDVVSDFYERAFFHNGHCYDISAGPWQLQLTERKFWSPPTHDKSIWLFSVIATFPLRIKFPLNSYQCIPKPWMCFPLHAL